MFASLNKLSSVDQLFALLRVITIIGGSSWIALSDLLPEQKIYLEYTILFFFIYSFLLYLLIIRNPERIRVYYITTFFLDLIFLYWLVRLTGGYQSVFHLAFLLLIALHAFYFGLRFGVIVATLASGTYLFSGDLSQLRGDWVDISLRIGFFYLTGTTLGLLSRKEARDRAQIYQLNRELVHERNKLSQILEGIHAGLILLDKERQILWMNRISKEWFGNWDESQRPTCHELIWHGNGECANCPTLRCIEKGEIQSGEVEYFRNGEVRYFRITSAPLKNEQGELEKVLELFQDITKEKEIQYHLIQTSKLAAVGELSSSIAHEINNPLGSIAICVQDIAEMLAAPYTVENKFDTDIRQNLEHIRSEIQRCKRITTGLLNLARGSEHKKAPTDVNQLVQNVVLLVNYKARKEKKELRLQLAKDLPLISADADGLSQVILNLLLNAIEFSPAGPSITLSTGKEGSESVFIKVSDRGFGIAPQNLGKIFQPFFTTKPAGSGTGLGLAISQRIVKEHGGVIKVESRLNKGTTFTVILPVGEPHSLKTDQKETMAD